MINRQQAIHALKTRENIRFTEVARLVVEHQNASTSFVQHSLGMGYSRATEIMDQLEAAGIIGPWNVANPREVLVKSIPELEKMLKG